MDNKTVKFISEMVVGTVVAETIKSQFTNAILGSVVGFGGGVVASVMAGRLFLLAIERTNIIPAVVNRFSR